MGILTKAVTVLARGLGFTSPQLVNFFSGPESYSGERVSVQSALQLDTVDACVRLISQTVATLPLPLYRRDNKGQSTLASDHSLYRILHDRPNVEMTATEFWEAMVACVLLWGNAFARIDRGAENRVVALTPLVPEFVIVRRQPDGSLIYTYSYLGKTETLSEDEILHIKGFSLDGLMGMSPIARARHSMGAAIAAEKASASIFRNGLRPSGIFKSPLYLNDVQRAQAAVAMEKYRGAINTGGTPLLEGGWDFVPLTIPPEDAQLLATRSFNVEVLCRWFGVPPIMVGHMEKTTAWGTGMEQMMLWFLTFSLRPHLKRIEQCISKALLSPVEQLTMFAEFNVEGLLRADSQGRALLYAALAQNGLRTRNELRALDNEPALPGGDDLTVQTNLIPVQLLGKEAAVRLLKPVDPGFVQSTVDPASNPDNQAAA